jgi:hypothetical protein
MVRRLEIGYQRPRRRQEIVLTIYNTEIRPKGEPWFIWLRIVQNRAFS